MLKYVWFLRSLTIPQLLLGMVLYGVLPVDVIPDFIPVLGQIDDIVVVLILLAIIAGVVIKRKKENTVKTVTQPLKLLSRQNS